MSRTLLGALRVFDEAALEALASKGLVRRAIKDVEAGKATVALLDDDRAVVAVDGESVEITSSGPRTARCSCPDKDVCRHKLSAVIALRWLTAEATSPSARRDSEHTHSMADLPEPEQALWGELDPLAECLALGVDDISAWLGKARMRAALDLVANHLDASVAVDGAGLLIRLGGSVSDVRFIVGQGLDGIVSKTPAARQKIVHAAAVLAVLRASGRLPDATLSAMAVATQEPSQVHRGEQEDAFLAQVRTALEDAAATALAQAPLVLEDRLFELSVSTRADGLPRLAMMLRSLSADIARRRGRDADLDAYDLLARIAATYALAGAIASGTKPPGVAGVLEGKVRQSYEPQLLLTLEGLGSEFWETASGARGVTGYFYAEELQRIVTISLARSARYDTRFDPRIAFANEVLWSASPLSELSRSRVILKNGALSPAGRLSLSGSARGVIDGVSLARCDPALWPVTYDDWGRLQAAMRRCFSGGLSRAPTSDAILLRPSAHAAATFNSLRQAYTWPIADVHGRWAALTLPFDPTDELTGHRLARLSRVAAVKLILAQARDDGDQFQLVPVSVVAATPSEPRPILYSLQLAEGGLGAPSCGMLDDWLSWLAKSNSAGQPVAVALTPKAATSPTTQALLAAADDLQAVAELGLRRLEPSHLSRLATHAARLERYGLKTLSGVLLAISAEGKPLASETLRAIHILDLARGLGRSLRWYTTSLTGK